MADKQTDELTHEIDRVLDRLAGNVDALVDHAHPKAVAGRQVERIKARFVNPDGSVRLETVVPIVGGVVGFVGLIVITRKLVKG